MAEPSNAPRAPHIADKLRKAIRDGEYRAGHQLPSARALAEHYKVSRGTANAAMAQLIREGLVDSRPRAGWFVAERAKPREIQRAIAPHNQPYAVERVSARLAEQADADALGVKPGTPVLEIHRTEHGADGNVTGQANELLPAAGHILLYEVPSGR